MNMQSLIAFAVACALFCVPVYGANDVLDASVSLKTEADLVKSVAITLQHAITTSERLRTDSPRLRKFAEEEVRERRKKLRQLSKRVSWDAPPVQTLAIAPVDDRRYLQAMQRNHARLAEIIEHGMSLPLSKDIKRVMEALAAEAIAEMTFLEQLEKP